MYSDFRKLTSKGFVKSVRIDESSNQIFFNVPVRTPEEQAKKRSWIPGRRKPAPATPSGKPQHQATGGISPRSL